MKQQLLSKLKEKLEKEQEELEKSLSFFAKEGNENSGNWETKFSQFGEHTSEQDENVDEVEEYTNLLPVEYRLELQLLDVRRALEKMEKGNNYGVCEKCGKKIKEGRLKIIPEAKLCKKCIRSQEKTP